MPPSADRLRRALPLLVALIASACAKGSPPAVPPTYSPDVRVGQSNDPWREMGAGSFLYLEQGLQGLLMLPIIPRLDGMPPAVESVRVDVRVTLADTGHLLAEMLDKEMLVAEIGLDSWEGEELNMISSINDSEALHERRALLEIEVRGEGFGVSGGSPASASLTVRLRDPQTSPMCRYPDAPVTPPSPRFVDATAIAGLTHDWGDRMLDEDCLLRATLGGEEPLCGPQNASGGFALGDFDDDGWPDLYFTSPVADDHLYRNAGDGSFVDITAGSGLDPSVQSSGAAWADIDDDGDLDLYVSTLGMTRNHLYVNDGAGHFTEEAVARGAALDTGLPHAGMSIAVGDYDRDGYLDLYVGEWLDEEALGGAAPHSRLLHNLGAVEPGVFEDATDAAGVAVDGVEAVGHQSGAFVHAPAFVDLDDDGWPELALTSDFSTSRLFWNEGDGTFADGTVAAGMGTDGFGMGSAFADYDGDGDLDHFVGSITRLCNVSPLQGNRLYMNEGDGTFTDRTDEAGVFHGGWTWGAVPLDYDNDGDVDLAHTGGAYNPIYTFDPMRLYRNDGSFPFAEVSEESGLVDLGQGRGMGAFDYDGDGDLDLIMARNADTPILYRNDGSLAEGWLRVRLSGDETNTVGLGARVSVLTRMGGARQVRQMGVGSHFMGQDEAVAHFGLGSGADAVAEVRVDWPVSGRTTLLTDVPRNQTLLLSEPDS